MEHWINADIENSRDMRTTGHVVTNLFVLTRGVEPMRTTGHVVTNLFVLTRKVEHMWTFGVTRNRGITGSKI